MKLLNIKKLEDCIDGSIIFMYSFNEKIDETFMKKLGEKENLQYYPEFPRPFFKIITADGIQLKGIIGEDNFEVLFPKTNKQERKKKFETDLKKKCQAKRN
jgi:hypothetical protein